MARNEQLKTACAEGWLVVTTATISIKPPRGPRGAQHWSIRLGSLATVDVQGDGPYRQVTFATTDGRHLVASRVPANDAYRLIAIFAPLGQVSGAWPPTQPGGQSQAPQVPLSPAPPAYPIAGNAPTLPSPWTRPASAFYGQQAPMVRALRQRFAALSLNGKMAVIGLSLILVFACCGVGLDAVGAAGGLATTAQATETPAAGALLTSPSPTQRPSPTPKPKPTATPKPRPTATPKPQPTCIPGAVNCNPWGYNFTPGKLISNPPSAFCTYFNCIPTFWNGSGYVVECVDKTYSKSGGRSGACSQHGGVWRTLYAH